MPISGCPFQIYQITLLTKKHTSVRFFRVKKYIDGVLGPISANYGVPGCKTRGQWPFRGAGNNDVKFNLRVELCEYNYCNKHMHIACHIHFHGLWGQGCLQMASELIFDPSFKCVFQATHPNQKSLNCYLLGDCYSMKKLSWSGGWWVSWLRLAILSFC